MSLRAPPAVLEPYLKLPPEFTQILLTSTLGCSINWLTARLVGNVLNFESSSPKHDGTSVILASWLRSPSFWKAEIRRTTGLDLSKPQFKDRIIFIDCFSFAQSLSKTQEIILQSISRLPKTTSEKDSDSASSKPVLILDSPALLLATSEILCQDLTTFLMHLRSQVHSSILTSNADLPLISAATTNLESRPTPIEMETTAFVVSQAHVSGLIMSVRELETGAARDVSGVLRVTRGGHSYDEDRQEVKEAELLFLVQRDGNVKVFRRGSDD